MRAALLTLLVAACGACGRVGYDRLRDATVDGDGPGDDGAVGEGCGSSPPTCTTPGIITIAPRGSRSISGRTHSQGDLLDGSCVAADYYEYRLIARATADGTFRITTEGSSIDVALYVLDGGCDGEELACNDGAGASEPLVVLDVAAGEDILVVADAKSPVCGGVSIRIDGI